MSKSIGGTRIFFPLFGSRKRNGPDGRGRLERANDEARFGASVGQPADRYSGASDVKPLSHSSVYGETEALEMKSLGGVMGVY